VALARERLRGCPRRVADEEDVALSAFDSFCRGAEKGHFPRLTDPDGLWRVLMTIVVRKAADHANHQRRKMRGSGDVRGDSALLPGADGNGRGFDQLPGGDPAPDLAAQLAEEFQCLLDRLEKVNPEFRDIAVWRLEGFSNAEIACRLGCAEVTVERKLGIIRKILQDGDGS
jgi:DNA-directed RNA polymerase specialized sigma24 family protein